MSGERAVVLGNGIAGLTACDTLRDTGFDGEIVLVGDERHGPYSRPALSKAALLDAGEMTSHRLPAPTHEAVELLGVAAARLDPDKQTVTLTDGTDLRYDGLVIATGARARRLAEDSAELTVRTLDDALALRARLAARPSVVVVGDGPLGMEVASGCLATGCAVTLVTLGRPLLAQLGPFLSDVFVTAARQSGLRLVTAGSMGFAEEGGSPRVVLDGGGALEADLVVTAIGDVPNVAWLASSGLLTGGALVADARGRIRPGIVAAGDVATVPTRRGPRRVPLWTSAIDQAKTAAAALLKGDEIPPLDLQPYFWTEQFGRSLKASGFLPGEGTPETLPLPENAKGALLRWTHPDGTATAVALDHRIPVPRLRRLTRPAAAV
ncbi:NADPH-dependent 2,4-dienoyl-CoA reductase/sulfur reductase-like enzyme [Actinocorallia herbida]|uniref:NADPH-dependent 2,4-dienoyl-CoA reductase/sulfur reductase-like enzyme n=1 Tax=Actinocorallia herbida TaxID=58109 RepID=A0A3N1D5X2_9ACTN|nr:FAD-dependent oxidoreductase [Actinocorallia herbida]ROO88924.1 NADPH-dependent 2,4-dienoyl-CoA reductase/sulfur reductase-like enzyme [Actinocorallia herbida]